MVLARRQVNPEGAGNLPLATVAIPQEGRRVHLRGYGFIRVFRTVSKDGDVGHWATNDPDGATTGKLGAPSLGNRNVPSGTQTMLWRGEMPSAYGRGTAIHIRLSLQAFLRLEAHRLSAGASWYESKAKSWLPRYEDYVQEIQVHSPSNCVTPNSLAPYGITGQGKPHPRFYGTFV